MTDRSSPYDDQRTESIRPEARAIPPTAALKRLLGECWSSGTSSLWSAVTPSLGQCGVTALVLNDHFGGEILKTRVGDVWHFYNRVANTRVDATDDQFPAPLDYLDLSSSRDEAFADTSESQYRELSRRFAVAVARAGLRGRAPDHGRGTGPRA